MSCLNQFKPRISEIFFIISNNRRFSLFKNSTLPAFGRRSLKTAPCLLCARYNAAMPQSMVQKACLRLLKSAGLRAARGRRGPRPLSADAAGRAALTAGPTNRACPGPGLKARPSGRFTAAGPPSRLRPQATPEAGDGAAPRQRLTQIMQNINICNYRFSMI